MYITNLERVDSQRQTIIKSITDQVIKEKPVAVLLIGSTARGIYTPDSDIDIAVFYHEYEGEQLEYLEIGGISVGIEKYSLQKFVHFPIVPMLSEKELREIGRFTQSIILYNNYLSFDNLFVKFNNAVLAPDRALFLLNIAHATLQDAVNTTEFFDMWPLLQGCASALSRLQLSFSPYKYQKPKWMIHDLLLSRNENLLSIMCCLYSVRGKNSDKILKIVEACLLQACDSAKFPGLVLAPTESYEFRYMHRTWLDALSLKGKDENGCKYTSLTALRQMGIILSELTESLPISYSKHWMQNSVKMLFDDTPEPLTNLLNVAYDLETISKQLSEQCSRVYS